MNWKLPNQLTVGRIALAAAFFILLGIYEQTGDAGRWLLMSAFVIYIVAGITDVLDGWIARRYHWTSAFGRIVDPFVDKVLVVGAFVMLCGSNYTLPPAVVAGQLEWDLPAWVNGRMFSGVQAWMVVVVMAREFIVSAVRGYSESQGKKFPATPAGKIKMFLQSVAICTALYQMANLPGVPWAICTKLITIWLALIATVLSGLVYVNRAKGLMKGGEGE